MEMIILILTMIYVILFWLRFVAGPTTLTARPDRVEKVNLESVSCDDPPVWMLGIETGSRIRSGGTTS